MSSKDNRFSCVYLPVPETVPQKIDTTMELMSQMREENLQRLIKYTTLVQPYFLRNIIFKMGRREVRSEMVHVRQGLVMVHQILIYLKCVMLMKDT
jgi:hypothetical protein